MQGDTYCPAHPVAQLQLAYPYGLRAIGAFVHLVLYREKRSRPMVMRNVPFHAARDPGTQDADQRRLDDMLVIDELVAVGLVHRLEDFAAQFRDNADLYVLVFEIDHGVGLVRLLRGQAVVQRVGVDTLLRALRHCTAAEIELRIRIGRSDEIGRNRHRLLPHLYLPLCLCCSKQQDRSCHWNHRCYRTQPGAPRANTISNHRWRYRKKMLGHCSLLLGRTQTENDYIDGGLEPLLA